MPGGIAGAKTRGESADSPLTTMPETPTPALFLVGGLSRLVPGRRPRRLVDFSRTCMERHAAGRQSRARRRRETDNICRRLGAPMGDGAACMGLRPGSPDRIRATLGKTQDTKLLYAAGLLLALAAAATSAGCGKAQHSAHDTAKTSPAPAPPTPDTTPIEALRTPAGLVLKIDEARTPTGPPRGPTGGGGEAPAAPTPSRP